MLLMYRDWLRAALEHDFREDPQSIVASRLRDHLESATGGLIENRLMEAPDQAGSFTSPQVEESASALKPATLPPVEEVEQEPVESVIEGDAGRSTNGSAA